MKLLLISFIGFLFISCSGDRNKIEKIDISSVQMQDSVWICTSSGAKRFHASDTCGGVLSCGEEIVPTTRHEAEKGGRTYCHKCYTKNH